ncbi:MAG: hypothetical protein GY778_16165 [bacterium]|nr:hypothetical protein [bacterium]
MTLRINDTQCGRRFWGLVAVAACCGLAPAGCSQSTGPSGPAFGPLFPPAQATPRLQYLRSLNGGSNFQNAGGLWQRLIGGAADSAEDLIKPYGLAAADGKLFVCDSARGDVFVFDFARQSFGRWAHPEQELSKPLGIRITETGLVEVCDVGLGAVVTFRPDGGLVGLVDLAAMRETTPSASLPAAFRPVASAGGPQGATAVLNAAAHRVELIDPAGGRHMGSWSKPGSGPGDLYYPTAMTQAGDGTLWITDRMNRRLLALGSDGRAVGGFGDAGDQPGYISQPRGVAVDEHSVVYVVDGGLPGVQLFETDGTFLMGFGYPGDEVVFTLPAGICLDRSCLPYFADDIRPDFQAEYLVFVSDQSGPHRIHVFAFGSGWHPTGSLPPVTEAGGSP